MCRSVEDHERQPDAGFTMIEALVALGVIAISLAAIGAVIASSVRATRWVDDRLSVVETARAVLAALPDRQDLSRGNSSGAIGENQWRVDVLPFSADFIDPDRPTQWIPQTVVIRVESPSGEVLRVDTVRLQRPPG